MLQICSLLVWMMGITSVNTLRSRNSELNTIDLVVTGYQSLGNVHIDGQEKLLTNARNWSLTDHIALSSISRLIALEGMISNSEPCAGVLASVNDSYLLTSSLWKCSTYNAVNWTQLGFDDSAWPNAVEYGSNGNHATCTHQRHFDDISSNAKWIWSYDLNTLAVYCRGYLPLCQTSSPCLNGGTCLPNHKKICDCTPEYTGTYCESLLMDGSLVITAYKTLVNMYIDGIEQPLINGSRWDYTDRAGLTETNRLVAVKATGDGTCGGILASFGDAYVLTNAKWRCSPYNFGNWYGLGFNDSQQDWYNAAEFGSNADGHTQCSGLHTIPDISLNAMWIWIADQTDGGSVFCRGYMPVCDSSPCLNNGTCLQNDVKMCHCQPHFTGTYCETEILTTLETTKTTTVMTTHPQTTQGVTTGTLRTTEVTTLPQTTQALCQTSSHCLNGGTCLPNQEKMCDCPPQFTGTYCETELMDDVLVITAYQQLPLMYIDGEEQTLINGNMWNQTDRVGLTKTNRLVAVKAVGDGTCGGILASVGDAYFLTNAQWKCSQYLFSNWYILGFDDSQAYWFNAVEFGSNADGHTHCSHLQVIPDISANAMWIWDADQTEMSLYCRGYIPVCDSLPCQNNGTCLQNNVKICSCLPQFTGTYCETAITTTLETTKRTTVMTTHPQTTEGITTSNLQTTEVTTLPQTTQALCQTSSHCLNGGTCLPNPEKMCDCPPQFTGTYCETELMAGSLVITAYQQLELMYIDGIEETLINGNMWNQTDRAWLTETNRLVAVKATGDGTCGGILASFGDAYVLTNAEWKCSPYNFGNWYRLGFDDSTWSNAVEFGSNANGHTRCIHLQYIPDISPDAMWIWVTDQSEKSIYCRGYMPVCELESPCLNGGVCLTNSQSICSCLPGFVGAHCETVDTKQLRITASETLYSVYVDAKPIPLVNGTVSISPDSVTLGSLSRVIAVMAIHQAFSCPGILLSITDDKGDYVVSDSGWKCTNNAKTGWYEPGYDDSAWQTAVEVKRNGDTNGSVCVELSHLNGISSNAFWIWTDAQPIHDVAIYCRQILPICEAMPCQNGATCNETEDRLCTCLPGFSGIYCEQILPPSTIIDSRS